MIHTTFCFPTEAEASLFRELCPDAEIVIVGVGVASAAAFLAAHIARANPSRVVLCGIAGACDEVLQAGDVVEVVADSVAGLPECFAERYEPKVTGLLPRVNSLTVNHTGDALRYLPENQDLPCIEQMEGAGVAAACYAMGIADFYHIRAISNRVTDERSEWRTEEAITALGRAVAQLFKE